MDPKTYKKPLFFDIALNYVQLDMEALQKRAGKAPVPVAGGAGGKVGDAAKVEAKPISRAKAEEQERPATPEPQKPAPSGGLSSLLGGWWGRK